MKIVNRRYKNGALVSETEEHIDWTPSAADLDQTPIICTVCGNETTMASDALMYIHEGMYCGQCRSKNSFEVKQ